MFVAGDLVVDAPSRPSRCRLRRMAKEVMALWMHERKPTKNDQLSLNTDVLLYSIQGY